MLDLRPCPGHRILRGNHDTARGGLWTVDSEPQSDFALYVVEPRAAQHRAGHFHERTEPTRRHVNLAVEHREYGPVPMTHVFEVAHCRPPALGSCQERIPLRAG